MTKTYLPVRAGFLPTFSVSFACFRHRCDENSAPLFPVSVMQWWKFFPVSNMVWCDRYSRYFSQAWTWVLFFIKQVRKLFWSLLKAIHSTERKLAITEVILCISLLGWKHRAFFARTKHCSCSRIFRNSANGSDCSYVQRRTINQQACTRFLIIHFNKLAEFTVGNTLQLITSCIESTCLLLVTYHLFADTIPGIMVPWPVCQPHSHLIVKTSMSIICVC